MTTRVRRRGGHRAEHHGDGQALEDGVEEHDEGAHHHGRRGEHDGPEAHGAGLTQGLPQVLALPPLQLGEVDEQDGVAHDDARPGR